MGQRVLVTAGAGGIGRAIAEASRRTARVHVVVFAGRAERSGRSVARSISGQLFPIDGDSKAAS